MAARAFITGLSGPALAACRLVVCDLMLPGLSGLDLARAIHARRPGLPVVIISGYAIRQNAERALEAGWRPVKGRKAVRHPPLPFVKDYALRHFGPEPGS